MSLQSKMRCKKKPASFLTSIAECGKMTLVAKYIFICWNLFSLSIQNIQTILSDCILSTVKKLAIKKKEASH